MCQVYDLDARRAGILAHRTREQLIAGPASIGLRTGDSIYVHETKRPHPICRIAASGKPEVYVNGIQRVLSPQEWERV